MNLFHLIYVGKIKPFPTKIRNNQELLNELWICTLTFHTMYFTAWVPLGAQEMYGIITVFVTSGMLAFNVYIVIVQGRRPIKLMLMKCVKRIEF